MSLRNDQSRYMTQTEKREQRIAATEKREQRIAALEAKIAEPHERLDSLEKLLRLLADDWRKQRAVNLALVSVLPHIHRELCFRHQWETLKDALYETLK